ncbi:MAG: capsule assembly Wzi family protein [Spirochaetales bacterium]|nr:capsule assembly Wzi family protein [Spirochaetales bacterium]
MKRKLLPAALLLLAGLTVPLTAQGQEIIPLASPFYAGVDNLYLIAGLAAPTSVRPWSRSEARLILDRLEGRLPEMTLPFYEQLNERASAPLRFPFSPPLSLGVRVDLALETYAHSNTEDYVIEEDWIQRFVDRAPLFKTTLELAAGDWFYGLSDFQIGWNYTHPTADQRFDLNDNLAGIAALIPLKQNPPGNWEVRPHNMIRYSQAYADSWINNIPPDLYYMDPRFPKRALLSFGGTHWNLSFGRDRLSWGNGHSGNLILGGHREYDNFVRFAAFFDRFRYDLGTVIFDKHIYFFVPDAFLYTPGAVESRPKSRYFLLHRLEFRPSPRLVLAISENVMYQDEYFNLRYFNPAFIYHNFGEYTLFNAIAGIEADWAAFRGFNVYLQAVLDDATAPNEPTNRATAYGLLGGMEYALPLRLGRKAGVLSLSLEGAYTTPMLYRREFVDFLALTKWGELEETNTYIIEYIGYPYGGDAIVGQFDASLSFAGGSRFALGLFAMLHGSINPLVSHNTDGINYREPNIRESTPSGQVVEKTYILSLSGEVPLALPFWGAQLSVFGELHFVSRTNKKTYTDTTPFVDYLPGTSRDVQFSLGTRLTL